MTSYTYAFEVDDAGEVIVDSDGNASPMVLDNYDGMPSPAWVQSASWYYYSVSELFSF